MKLLLIFMMMLFTTPAFAKKVTIEWKAHKAAVKYEIIVEKDGKQVAKKILEEPLFKADLDYGLYVYQIRAIDRINRLGQWSEARPLVVMPKAPEVISPRGGKTVALYNPSAGVLLKWTEVPGVKKYKLEVKRNKSPIVETIVEGNSFDLKNTTPGEFSWKVSAVIEAASGGGRLPASDQGKVWETKFSDTEEFEIEGKSLERATPIYPLGVMLPPSDGQMKFKWSKSDGAEAYEVHLRPLKLRSVAAAANAKEQVVKTTDDNIMIPTNGDGLYTWDVIPLSNIDSKGVAGAIGPKSTANFDINRNAKFFEGSGYIALSTVFSSYTYTANSPISGSVTNPVTSTASGLRLSGEYFFQPQWGVGAAAEDTMLRIRSKIYNRKGYEATVRYRARLGDSKYGWSIYPKVGIEARDYFLITSGAGSTADNIIIDATNMTAYGPQVGFDIRRQFTDRFSVGLKTQYFIPLMVTGVNGLTGDKNTRNLSVGLQGYYWLGGHVAVGAGGIYDQRSLSFARTANGVTTGASPESVNMDATYFFGTFIYTFGN